MKVLEIIILNLLLLIFNYGPQKTLQENTTKVFCRHNALFGRVFPKLFGWLGQRAQANQVRKPPAESKRPIKEQQVICHSANKTEKFSHDKYAPNGV